MAGHTIFLIEDSKLLLAWNAFSFSCAVLNEIQSIIKKNVLMYICCVVSVYSVIIIIRRLLILPLLLLLLLVVFVVTVFFLNLKESLKVRPTTALLTQHP